MLAQQRQVSPRVAAVLPLARRAAPHRTMVAVVVSVAALICVARAAEPPSLFTAQPFDFEIPSQPLAGALHAYGRRMGIQVLYESRSAAGRQSGAVQGKFTANEALKRLLAGTDLEIRYAGLEAVTLVARTPSGQDLPSPNAPTTADLSIGELRVRASGKLNDLTRFHEYSESVRSEIQRALIKNARTGSGNYRVVIDLWIDPSRIIQRTALLQSTGETARDAAITSTLQGLTINRPTPADAPQPIRAVVVVRTSQ